MYNSFINTKLKQVMYNFRSDDQQFRENGTFFP